jgi:hypothetical protein
MEKCKTCKFHSNHANICKLALAYWPLQKIDCQKIDDCQNWKPTFWHKVKLFFKGYDGIYE